MCLRIHTVHAHGVHTHIRVVHFVGGFEGAAHVGVADTHVARFVGTLFGQTTANTLRASVMFGADICVVTRRSVRILDKDVLCTGMAAPCNGFAAADTRFALVVGGAFGSVVAGGVGQGQWNTAIIGAHVLVAGGGGTVGGVCTAVGDWFETTDCVADTTLAVGAGAILVCGTKVE